jgi:hypothetical protein
VTVGTREPTEPVAHASEHFCARCGAPAAPAQEYCLECGLRLHEPGPRGALRSGWLRRTGREPAGWLVAAALALVVAAAGAVLAIVLPRDEGRGGTLVFTSSVASLALQSVTIDTGTLPTPPTGTTPTSTQPPSRAAPRPRTPIPWPAGRSGYTVILNSIPRTPEGRRLALSQARGALRRGLAGVGVLDSSRYSSLHPGYWVVFYGVLDSFDAAAAAVARARSAGFDGAYGKQITT